MKNGCECKCYEQPIYTGQREPYRSCPHITHKFNPVTGGWDCKDCGKVMSQPASPASYGDPAKYQRRRTR